MGNVPSNYEPDSPEQRHFLYRALCLQQHLKGPTQYDKLWLYHSDSQATGRLVLTLIAEQLGVVDELPDFFQPFEAGVEALDKIEHEIAAGRFPRQVPRKDLPNDRAVPADFDVESAIRQLHKIGSKKIGIPVIPNAGTEPNDSNMVYFSALCGRCGFNVPDDIVSRPESFVFRLRTAARLI